MGDKYPIEWTDATWNSISGLHEGHAGLPGPALAPAQIREQNESAAGAPTARERGTGAQAFQTSEAAER
jgi:protein gp37